MIQFKQLVLDTFGWDIDNWSPVQKAIFYGAFPPGMAIGLWDGFADFAHDMDTSFNPNEGENTKLSPTILNVGKNASLIIIAGLLVISLVILLGITIYIQNILRIPLLLLPSFIGNTVSILLLLGMLGASCNAVGLVIGILSDYIIAASRFAVGIFGKICAFLKFSNAGERVKDVKEDLKAGIDKAAAKVEGVISDVQGKAKEVVDTVTAEATKVGDAVEEKAAEVKGAVEEKAEAVGDAVQEQLSSLKFN